MAQLRVVCPDNEGLALFIYWRREELMKKPRFSENLDATFSTAYKNVCDHATPICSLHDASQVRGIGKWMLNQIKDFFNDGLEDIRSSQEENPGVKRKRKYLPQKNSAPYALLITLYRTISLEKPFMMKQQLIDATELSGLSRMPIQPSKGSSGSGRFSDSTKDWYSGWSSMKTLISKGLVVKSSNPAKYMLTDEGRLVAEECMKKGGLENDQAERFDASTLAPAPIQGAEKRKKGQNNAEVVHQKRIPATVELNGAQASSQGPPDLRVRTPSVLIRAPADNATGCATSGSRDHLPSPPLGTNERFCDVYKVILILDDREHFARVAKGINTKLKFAERLHEQYRVQVEIRHLPVGDAIWVASHKISQQEYVLDFVVERKRVDDLWMSIRDTRYKQQKLRLQRCGLSRLIYLIEGDPNLTEATESLKTAYVRFVPFFFTMFIKCRALTTEILDGFDVQRTRDVHDTINRYGELTNAIARRYSFETGAESSRAQCMSYEQFVAHCNNLDKEKVTDVFGVQLMQVKHVTEDIALSILEKYPTLLTLVQAYRSLEGDTQKQKDLLVGLPIRYTSKTVGRVVSNNVFKFVWAG